ncbi:unnamed protein product [Coregonus sp. 'balchen']|nr:unnamed protein product [Coregonus sp. 'balchen']
MQKWVSLTAQVNQELATRLQLLLGRVCAFSDVIPELQLTHTKNHEEQNLPRNDKVQTYPPGATPAQITQCSPDLSYALDILLEKHQQQPLNVLGPASAPGPIPGPQHFQQLGEIPPDFSVDIVSQDNYLTFTLQDFFQFASGPGVDGTPRKRAKKFKAHLTTLK